ncbi:MAG: cobalamin-binding protein [Myxococcales bacterium]|nr:cobalamin-binding protein [Myxococcales bacterium]
MSKSNRNQTSSHRLICLVPSLSETLYALDLEDAVVGITRYCVHPPNWLEIKTIIGGTKDPKLEKMIALKPTLVIANDEENRKEDVVALREAGCRVYVSHIETFSDLMTCINDLSELLQRTALAKKLITHLTMHYDRLKDALLTTPNRPPKVLYLIWRRPYMAVAQNTWIDHILTHLGCLNACSHLSRYPVVELTQLAELKVDYVFLSSEPYSFKEKHIDEITQVYPEITSLLVDGEVFSWYGPRLFHLEQEVQRIAPYFKS